MTILIGSFCWNKKYIGDLSAYCGATCAGCAAVAGIAYIEGQPLDVLGNIVVNAISTIGGMVCDGAKSSCAAKIAASIPINKEGQPRPSFADITGQLLYNRRQMESAIICKRRIPYSLVLYML